MIITKIFKGEMAHIVRRCSTKRCAQSIHGHSYIVEVSLTSDKLDNGQMLLDFGLMKSNIKTFIDSFDHCMSFWKEDSEEFKDTMKKLNDRWIELPVSPSAESMSILLFYWIDRILNSTQFNNGEGRVKVFSVKYHETTTGAATAFEEDLEMLPIDLGMICSKGVLADWSPELLKFFVEYNAGLRIRGYKSFINPIVNQ